MLRSWGRSFSITPLFSGQSAQNGKALSLLIMDFSSVFTHIVWYAVYQVIEKIRDKFFFGNGTCRSIYPIIRV